MTMSQVGSLWCTALTAASCCYLHSHDHNAIQHLRNYLLADGTSQELLLPALHQPHDTSVIPGVEG